MNKPILFAGIYGVVIVALQYVLMSAMPNTGMGGMALVYIVWPLLAASVFAVYWLLRRMHGSRLLTFLVVTGLAAFLSIAVHPHDGPLSFSQKLERISRWIAGG